MFRVEKSMRYIPLIDLNAKTGSFEEEAKLLNLDYCFRHSRLEDFHDTVIITDEIVPYIEEIKANHIYLWLMEPVAIKPEAYNGAEYFKDRLSGIFSHDKNFCAHLGDGLWYPWGSYYIPLDQHRRYTKTKNVSIVASAKNWTPGQKLRHEIIGRYGYLFDGIKQGDPIEPKIKWHEDYRFTVAVENCELPGYFTEKIIDCFRTGVIPIYNGDPEILDHFDKEGVITFNNIDELEDILRKCNEDYYMDRKKHIKKNFFTAYNYLFPWKYIKEKHLSWL